MKVTVPTSFSRLHIAPYLPQFLERYPDIELDFQLTDNFADIIRDGFDLAIRIGELKDSSLVARKSAPDTRVICGSPAYLEKAGRPQSIEDLKMHNCLCAGAQDNWHLEDKDGTTHNLRVKGNIRSNSAEFIRQSMLCGLGLGLRATWDVGPEINSGELEVVFPDYGGPSGYGIYAVYPCREFMPAKVNAFIEFLGDLYGPKPYWNECLQIGDKPKPKTSAKKPPKSVTPETAQPTTMKKAVRSPTLKPVFRETSKKTTQIF